MSVSDDRPGIIITETGVSAPDASVIRQYGVATFKGIYGQDLDTSPYTPQGQIIDSETAVIHDKNSQLLEVLNQFDPEKNNGIWQEGIGKIYFMTRKSGFKTTVQCEITGIVGTVVPSGAQAIDKNGNLYALSKDTLINTPSPITVTFVALESGPIVCPAESLDRIYKRVNGWDTVLNSGPGVTGSYPETRIAFEKRRYDSVAKNAHGNVDSVRGAVANLDDVISVRIAENKTNWDSDDPRFIERHGTRWPGIVVHGHSMFISILGGKDTEIAKAIWERIDGGCGQDGNTTIIYNTPTESGADTLQEPITFNRPSVINGKVLVRAIVPTAGPENIDTLIKQAVVDSWNGHDESSYRVEIGDTVYASRFYCPLNRISGYELASVQVGREDGAFGESFATTLNEYATISSDLITVVHI